MLCLGGNVIVCFSDRCVPTMAVTIWRALDLDRQAALLRLHLDRAGFSDAVAHVLADGRTSDPLIALIGRA